MKLNKSDLIVLLAARSGIPVPESEKILNNLSSLIGESLAHGALINWQGFGRFSVFATKETIRKNPATRKLMVVPAHNRPKFIAGTQLKKAVL